MAEAYLVPEHEPLSRRLLGALTSLGRHPENNIEVADRSVSKFHAQILRTPDDSWLIQDLGSRNGTYLDGRRIDKSPLRHGSDVVFGTVRFRFAVDRMQQVTATLGQGLGAAGGVTLLGASQVGRATVAFSQDKSFAIELADDVGDSNESFLPANSILDVAALRRDYEKLRIAHELNMSLRLDDDVDTLLHQIAARTFDLLAADRCAILLMADDGQMLVPRVVMERGGGEPSEQMQLSQTVLNEVLSKKQAVLSQDVATDGRFEAAKSIVALSIRSAMCVPIIFDGEIYGAFHVDSSKQSHAFMPKDLTLFSSIASQTAMVLKNARLLQEIQKETETRALLGRLLSPNLVEEVVNGKLDLSPGGEERNAAVLFSDIRGFTSLSEKLTASEVTALLNEYFEVMVDVVFQHGGTLDKYMGDAIMALFGVPKDDPDRAIAAVRCGLQMQAALRSLNRVRQSRGDEPLYMGIGINVGDCIWGPLGSRKTMDYTVVGDVVNVASRLCSMAGAGDVIVSQSVREACQDRVVVSDLPPATLKGKARPVPVYRVEQEIMPTERPL
jgi:adenylate cyclase